MRANNIARTGPGASLEDVLVYAHARHQAYLHRTGRGHATTDQILWHYSFTNLQRALDRGTQELWSFYDQWGIDELGFVVAVSRVINRADIMAAYAPTLVPYRANALATAMEQRKADGLVIRHNAYMMTTHGSTDSFEEFYARQLFPQWWRNRAALVAPAPSLAHYAARIQGLAGIGAFLAGQIVADLKPRLRWMRECADYNSWFILGPGSKRALKILGQPSDAVLRVRDMVNAEVTRGQYHLDAQDAQNVLCEFDKYWRVAHGHGYRRKRAMAP